MNALSENDHSREKTPGALVPETQGSDTDAPDDVGSDSAAAEHERVTEAYEAEHFGGAEAEASEPETVDRDAVHTNTPDVEDWRAEESEDTEYNEEEEDDDPQISLKGKRVLLIEDDNEFAEGITEYLKELGIAEVLLANNAEAGLSYLTDRQTFPHIVLLELALIGMDGIQFLAQLRASKSKRIQNLPAVVITMLDSPSIYRRAANQKVGAFLRKPVAVNALRDGLQAALRGDIVEKPFSHPKSWLDDVDEQELRAKREANIAKANAKAQKQGFLVRVLNALIPWSGKA